MFLNLLIFFFCYSIVISSLFILINQNPVFAILLLILIFFLISCLLLINNFVFLSFFFLSIYIGAIAIFFLFVVRLINIPIYTYYLKNKVFYVFFLMFGLFFFFKLHFNSVFIQNELYNFNIFLNLYTGTFDTLNYLGNTFYNQYIVFLVILTYIFVIIIFGTMAILQNIKN